MEFYFATGNKGKLISMQREFFGLGVKIEQLDYDIPEVQSSEVLDIALFKARHAYGLVQKPVVAVDAGFHIDALNGFPGPYVKHYIGQVGLEKTISLVDLFDPENRAAHFSEALAYFDGVQSKVFRSVETGKITREIRGNKQEKDWSTLSTIYIPDGFDVTLAEMPEEMHLAWKSDPSHVSVVKLFAKWYSKEKMGTGTNL